MNDFYPFIHEPKKKKEIEFEPLYIELIEPPLEKQPEKENNDSNIIIIQL